MNAYFYRFICLILGLSCYNGLWSAKEFKNVKKEFKDVKLEAAPAQADELKASVGAIFKSYFEKAHEKVQSFNKAHEAELQGFVLVDTKSIEAENDTDSYVIIGDNITKNYASNQKSNDSETVDAKSLENMVASTFDEYKGLFRTLLYRTILTNEDFSDFNTTNKNLRFRIRSLIEPVVSSKDNSLIDAFKQLCDDLVNGFNQTERLVVNEINNKGWAILDNNVLQQGIAKAKQELEANAKNIIAGLWEKANNAIAQLPDQSKAEDVKNKYTQLIQAVDTAQKNWITTQIYPFEKSVYIGENQFNVKSLFQAAIDRLVNGFSNLYNLNNPMASELIDFNQYHNKMSPA